MKYSRSVTFEDLRYSLYRDFPVQLETICERFQKRRRFTATRRRSRKHRREKRNFGSRRRLLHRVHRSVIITLPRTEHTYGRHASGTEDKGRTRESCIAKKREHPLPRSDHYRRTNSAGLLSRPFLRVTADLQHHAPVRVGARVLRRRAKWPHALMG